MKVAPWLVAFMVWFAVCPPFARALGHLQANRIHVFNAGVCNQPTGPMWITLGTGQPAPGFINVIPPGFDQIGALLTGNMPAESESELRAQLPACGVIVSFYKDAEIVGSWSVPPDKLLQMISILQRNG